MQNMYLYYKYIIRSQFLLKYPTKLASNLIKNIFKKILFEIYLENIKINYYIYLYNIAILIRLIINKFLYVKKIKKNYGLNKIYMGVILKKAHIYQFLDVFTTILLPIFESFNVMLDITKFDIFGNLKYRLIYCDPVFMSRSAVTVWSPLYSVNIKICFNENNKNKNFNILQQLKLKWYL